VEVKQHNVKKEIRILRLQPHIEGGRIKFPDPDVIRVPWWDGFFEEYFTYPKGRRDDRLDALEMLMSMVSESFGASGIPYGPSDDGALRRNLYRVVGGGYVR
jgi:phage terminase large subunit-like protein